MIPVILFAVTMTVTPGPNNLLLTATGARFGFRACLPLITGIVLGLISQLLLIFAGLGTLFIRFPGLQNMLKWAGSVYILYLAFRIAFSTGKKETSGHLDHAPGLLQGLAFQYLNPKAYIMTLTAISVYSLPDEKYLGSALFIILCFFIITPFSISLWAGFGSLLNQWMTQERYRKFFRFTLGGLTASSIVFIIH